MKKVMGLVLVVLCCGCGTNISTRDVARAKCTERGLSPDFVDVLFVSAEADRDAGATLQSQLVATQNGCSADVDVVMDCTVCLTAVLEAVYSEGGGGNGRE